MFFHERGHQGSTEDHKNNADKPGEENAYRAKIEDRNRVKNVRENRGGISGKIICQQGMNGCFIERKRQKQRRQERKRKYV